MSRADRLAALRLELRQRARVTVIEELATLTERSRALARHALRYRANARAAKAWAELCETAARDSAELLRHFRAEQAASLAELQRTAELLAEARAAAVPSAPVEAPDARHWREKYEQAKSELRRAQAGGRA